MAMADDGKHTDYDYGRLKKIFTLWVAAENGAVVTLITYFQSFIAPFVCSRNYTVYFLVNRADGCC